MSKRETKVTVTEIETDLVYAKSLTPAQLRKLILDRAMAQLAKPENAALLEAVSKGRGK